MSEQGDPEETNEAKILKTALEVVDTKRASGKKEIRIFLDEAELAVLTKIADLRKISVDETIHEAISTEMLIYYEFSRERVVIHYEYDDEMRPKSITPPKHGKGGLFEDIRDASKKRRGRSPR
jgi:hypothetical protein